MTRWSTNDLGPPPAVGILYPDALELLATGGRRVSGGASTSIGPTKSAPSDVAAYRARSRVRRYCVANRMNSFLTLTTEARVEPKDLQTELRRVLRATRRASKQAFPFVWVVELSAQPHVHLLTARDHVGAIANRWTLGFPDVETMHTTDCLLYTSPSPRDQRGSRMPSSA